MEEEKKNIKKQENSTNAENTEKNRPSKRQNKAFFISIGVICGLLLCAIYMIIRMPDEIPTSLANVRIERFKGEDYYIYLQQGVYQGEHLNVDYSLNAADQNANEYIKK